MQNIIFVGADESETKVVAKMLSARKNLEFISTDDFFGEGIDEIKKIPKSDCSIYVDTEKLLYEFNREEIKMLGRVIYLRSDRDKENVEYYQDVMHYFIDIDFKTTENIFNEAVAIFNVVNKIGCHIYIK